jgi:hypothetical protein
VLRHILADKADFVLEAMAADIALRLGALREAAAHAERAVTLAPNEPLALTTLAQTFLGVGAPERAAAIVTRLRQAQPDDQHLLALLATAWRLMGDHRYRELYDYDRLVGVRRLHTPEGWPDLAAYLAELAAGLQGAHAYHTHPFGLSVRDGSQAPDILNDPHPAIRAFPSAVAPLIAEHLQALGPGADPVRRRNTGRWSFNGVWSVRLRPQGFHANHTHPRGWLSSACYIALPSAVEGSGREGWLKFGEPGVPTRPALPAEHFVKPEPGLLALFPSYMWHGTVPFSGDEPRLTIAFDLAPT